jgi:DNA-binding NarL/FixJ family response regulator
VLVADDDPDILLLMTLTLERDGYDVVAAKDGLSALQTAVERVPHLVLLDVGALEHLRQVSQEAQLAHLADGDYVEFAVRQIGIGSDEHSAAESLAVGNRHRVAAEALARLAHRIVWSAILLAGVLWGIESRARPKAAPTAR